MVYGKDFLIQTVVHALQHRVVFGILRTYGKVFLDTRNAAKTHVLCNLNGIRTPWRDHLAARAYIEAVQLLCIDERCIAVEPTECMNLIGIWLMIDLRCNYMLFLGLEEKNHINYL